jgi:hypothetical protein
MKTTLKSLLIIASMAIGAIAHEWDIHRNLKEKGHADYAGWLGDIKGESLRK